MKMTVNSGSKVSPNGAMPSLRIWATTKPCGLKSARAMRFAERAKKSAHMTNDTSCDAAVAQPAPAVPHPSTMTNNQSKNTFTMPPVMLTTMA